MILNNEYSFLAQFTESRLQVTNCILIAYFWLFIYIADVLITLFSPLRDAVSRENMQKMSTEYITVLTSFRSIIEWNNYWKLHLGIKKQKIWQQKARRNLLEEEMLAVVANELTSCSPAAAEAYRLRLCAIPMPALFPCWAYWFRISWWYCSICRLSSSCWRFW